MALSFFHDRTHQPDDQDVARALAATIDLWNELRTEIGARFSPVSETWGCSGKSTGWGLRLARPTRTIVYLTPRDGEFLASFALGERAVRAAHESGLSPTVLEAIDVAPRYAEGRGVRLVIRTADDVREIVRLAEVKMAN
jgi:hypothetical protein